MSYQVGVFPYTKDGKIVLISNRRGTYWLFPKGQVEPDLKDMDTAREEAFEEAGIIGRISKRFHEFPMDSKKADFIRLYPMRVKKVLKHWPEQDERERKIVSVKKAESLLEDDLLFALKKLRKRLDL